MVVEDDPTEERCGCSLSGLTGFTNIPPVFNRK